MQRAPPGARLMRILLDECVDQRLRLAFTGHDCQTAGYAKLSGATCEGHSGVIIGAAAGPGLQHRTARQPLPRDRLDVWSESCHSPRSSPRRRVTSANAVATLRQFFDAD